MNKLLLVFSLVIIGSTALSKTVSIGLGDTVEIQPGDVAIVAGNGLNSVVTCAGSTAKRKIARFFNYGGQCNNTLVATIVLSGDLSEDRFTCRRLGSQFPRGAVASASLDGVCHDLTYDGFHGTYSMEQACMSLL